MKKFLTLMFTLFTSMTLLTSCKEEGPAEKAGKQIDESVEETKEQAKETKNEILEELGQNKKEDN